MGSEPTEREADVHLGRLSLVGSVQLASVPGQQCSLQTLNVLRNVQCLDFRKSSLVLVVQPNLFAVRQLSQLKLKLV